MNDLIAYCGLDCQGCPIHLLSLERDEQIRQKMKIEIAQICREQYGYGSEFTAENITDCDGCRAESGKLFSGCEKCEIRKCAIKKGFENCAYCNDYVCEKLAQITDHSPEAKARLDVIRSKL